MGKALYQRISCSVDPRFIGKRLRKADLAEVRAASGLDPIAVLKLGHVTSDFCMTLCLPDDTPFAMYGVQQGYIWMLATPDIEKCSVRFLRECRAVIVRINQTYSKLHCHSDGRNTLHHKWLHWCGFKKTGEQKMGFENRTFYIFERREQDHV